VLKVLEVLADQKQIIDTKNAINKPSNLPNYKYTVEVIDKFFASDNGQQEEHSLEDSICGNIIEKQNYKPFFLYCKMCSEVENIHLASIENHIRLKDQEKHKAKLLEHLNKEEEDV
jgi:hypothetical protein